MKLCKDCEYFHIKYEPYKYEGLYTEFGQAECTKHDLVTDFRSHKKFETLSCIEDDDKAYADKSGLEFADMPTLDYGA